MGKTGKTGKSEACSRCSLSEVKVPEQHNELRAKPISFPALLHTLMGEQ